MVSDTAARGQSGNTVFQVIDSLDHPHGGKILRLKLKTGSVPPLKELRGAELEAVSPDGSERRVVRTEGFPVFGGKPSDARVRRTGRVDLHVFAQNGQGILPINTRWTVSLRRGR